MVQKANSIKRFLERIGIKPRYLVWFSDFSAVVLILAMLVFSYSAVVHSPARYFEVAELYVSDSIEGTSPFVIYNRVPKKDFIAEWTVHLISTTSPYRNVCHGSGFNYYKPGLVDFKVTLDWFLGNTDCKLVPGAYLLNATWVINHDLDLIVHATSNEFRVWDKDDVQDISFDKPNELLQPQPPRR